MRLPVAGIRREAAEIGRPRLFFLSSLTTGHMVVHWYNQALSLVLPSLKADLNLNDIQVGTLTTTQQGFNNGGTLPSGFLADRFRRQGSLILAAAIGAFGLGLFVLGLMQSYAWALVGVALLGLGSALWHPCAMGGLSLRFPDRRGMALSMHGVGASIGDALAPFVLGVIITAVAWRTALQFHLIPALVFALILWRGLGASFSGQESRVSFKDYARGIGRLLANRQVLAVIACNTLIQMARLAVLTFLPIYIRDTLGYSDFMLGIYLTLLYVMGIASQPVMGVASDRLGRKAVLLPSFLGLALLYLAIGFAQRGVELGLVIAALGLFFYAILNITQTAVMDVAEKGVQASTMGVMSLIGQPFTLGAPVFAGFLVTHFGIKSAFLFASASSMAAVLVLLPLRFRRPPAGERVA